MADARYDIEWDGERVVVEGVVPGSHATAFGDALAQVGRGVVVAWGSLEIDMLDLELVDQVAASETIKALRVVMGWHREVRIHHAPHVLAEMLEAQEMLDEGDLELINPREGESATEG